MMKISVIGVGNVGLPFAAVASRFHEVVGIDIDSEWIEKLQQNTPLAEPLLNEYLNKWPVCFTTDVSAVKECETVFVIVGNQKDQYAPTAVIRALGSVCPYLVDKSQVLVIISTLKPSSMRRFVLPFLRKKRVLGKISGVCYNPVFVALGSAITYFSNPGFILIGESNHEAGLKLASFYRTIVQKDTMIYHSDLEDVEVAKYVGNFVLINKISMLSNLTEYCEAFDADIDFVTQILKADQRIAGPKMFKGGLGYGGACFPVDGRAFRDSQAEKLLDTSFVEAIIKVNDRQITRTVALIRQFRRKRISILGITYKENTCLTVESQALEIARKLAEDKDVMVYDPQGMESARRELGSSVRYAKDLEEALAFGRVILIAVMWPEFSQIENHNLRKDQIIIDPWRLVRDKKLGCKYVPFGLPH